MSLVRFFYCVCLVVRFWLHEFDCSILLGVLSREFLREFWLCEFGVRLWLYKFGCAILVAGFWWGFCCLIV